MSPRHIDEMSDTITNQKLYDELQSLRKEIRDGFVSIDAFTPVRAIAYGLAGLVMMAVGTAIVASVLRAAASMGILR